MNYYREFRFRAIVRSSFWQHEIRLNILCCAHQTREFSPHSNLKASKSSKSSCLMSQTYVIASSPTSQSLKGFEFEIFFLTQIFTFTSFTFDKNEKCFFVCYCQLVSALLFKFFFCVRLCRILVAQ